MSDGTSHYDGEYFRWQRSIGEFGGWANLPKFERHVRPDQNVIDFGCGGGYLLERLSCAGKIGIEINEVARREAQRLGLEVYPDASSVRDDWADVIVSDNALEHCTHPLDELRALHPKLKPGGTMVFVVPCESVRKRYAPDDPNRHLYSWSPMCLGNLFVEAGFVVEQSEPYMHKWPPGYRWIARVGGRRLFHACCRVYGRLERSWFQVRIVARKDRGP